MFVAPAEGRNYCLHQDCKRSHSTNGITNRTWIVDVSWYQQKCWGKFSHIYIYLALTLIILGGNYLPIISGGGAIWPENFFGVFIIKIKRKDNFMPILWFIYKCLNEYFKFYRYLKKTWTGEPSVFKNIVYKGYK